MADLSLARVVPLPKLRSTTLNKHGLSWAVANYSGYAVVQRDPTAPLTDAVLPVTVLLPDGQPAMNQPQEEIFADVWLRGFRSAPGAAVVAATVDEIRAELVEGPVVKKRFHLYPQLTFLVRLSGIDYAEFSYRIVVEDS